MTVSILFVLKKPSSKLGHPPFPGLFISISKQSQKLFQFHVCTVLLFFTCASNLLFRRPLRRMTVGMFLAATAFLISFFVQLKVESTLPKPVPAERAELGLVSLSDGCIFEASSGGAKLKTTSPFVASGSALFPAGALTFNLLLKCKTGQTKTQAPLALPSKESFELYGWQEGSTLRYKLVENSLEKHEKGLARVRAIYRQDAHIRSGVHLTTPGYSYLLHATNASDGLIVTRFESIHPGEYFATVRKRGKNVTYSVGHMDFRNGATVTLLPYVSTHGAWHMGSVVEVEANTVHLLFQIPQYILITGAEIMVSITGLSYSYTQAPESMKSTVSALWLVTVGIGNLVVVIVAEAVKSAKISVMLIIFTVLAYVTGVIFGIDAYFYVPNTSKKPKEEENYENVKDE